MTVRRELTPKDYLAMLQRKWLLIFVLAVIGGGSGLIAARYLPKRYISQTTVLIEQPTIPGDYVKPVVTDDINQRLSTMQEQILSRSRLEPVIRQYGLDQIGPTQLPMEEAVANLRRMITVTPMVPMAQTRSKDLPGFNISVTINDPRLAQQICSTITSMFTEENLQLRQDQAEQTTQFIGKQLDDAKSKLDDQDSKLADFKRHYLGSLPDEEPTNLNLLTGLNSQLEATTQALSRAQQDKSFAESSLAQQLSAWQSSQAGENPETFEQQLSALQSQLLILQSKYTDDHPDVVKAKSDIASLKKQIAASEELKKSSEPEKTAKTSGEPAQIQQFRTQIYQYDQVIKERNAQQEDIQKQIKMYQERVQSSPAVEQEYKELTRDYQTALDFYNDLLKKRDQSVMATDLERRQEGEQFRVLDPANLPNRPDFPNVPLFGAAGFGGGMALGLALALLLEMQDTSLRSERDVEHILRLPVFASLPVLTAESTRSKMQSSILGSAAAGTGTRP